MKRKTKTRARRALAKSNTPRDPERTRALILEAASADFARYGLGGARVDRIAASAGVNKRMLYYYFRDKENLFVAALEANYAHIRSAEQELDLKRLDPREAIKRLVAFTWGYLREHPEFITIVNSENLHKGRHLEKSHRVAQMQSPLIEMLSGILKRGVKLGLFRRGIDPVQLYISIAAEGYFYLSNRYTLSRVFGRDLMTEAALVERARHNTAMILNALRR